MQIGSFVLVWSARACDLTICNIARDSRAKDSRAKDSTVHFSQNAHDDYASRILLWVALVIHFN